MPATAPSIVTDSEKVAFKTSDQSMWSTGQALSINESWTLFSEGFSDSFSAFDDDLSVSASASVSLVFNVQGDAGGISLDYPINVSFDIPNVVAAGQQFTLQSTYLGLDSSSPHFDAKFPEFKIDLDAIFSADFALDFDSDFLGSDSIGYAYTDTIKLISLHSGDRKSIADGFDLFLPKDYDRSLTAEQVGTGAMQPVVLEVTTPDIASVTVDLISIIEDIVGPEFPSLSGSFLDGDISYDLLSADLQAGIAITQQFQFLPTGIDVTLTAPWGQSVTIPVGQSATFDVPYYWDQATTLTASYSLQGNLVNQTGFVGTATLDLSAIAGSVDDLGSFGPLYSNSFPLYESSPIYIYNPGGPGGFALDGFNTPTHTLRIDHGNGALVAPGDFEIDASGFTANDAALIQATIDAIAAQAATLTGTNLYDVGAHSGHSTAEADKLNVTIVSRAADSVTVADGFSVGMIWDSADDASLTGNAGTRLLAAAPKRGGSATLTAGANELMVAGQEGKVTFNISGSFGGSIAGLEAGDIINVAGIQSEGVFLDGSNLVFRSLWNDYQVAVSGDLANVLFEVTGNEWDGVTVELIGPPPPPGTDGDDTINGSSGRDSLNGGAGNDVIDGGGGADVIDLGTGADTLSGYWGDMNGDSVVGFGSDDTLDITGSLIGRNQFQVTLGPGTATLSAAGSSIVLNGDFTGGDFMVITRGSGADAHTTVTFQTYVPVLREGVRVEPTEINGVANEAFLTGDGFVDFTLELKSAVSWFANTLGSYRVATDGTITDVRILFANTLDVATRSVDLGMPQNNERIGFFLIQDGFRHYGNLLPDSLSFLAPGGTAAANLDAGLPPTLSSATRGLLTDADIFHSFATLNPEDANQVLSGVTPGGEELVIGFEDLPSATGDNDFQDVVIGIRVDTDNVLLLV